LGVSTYQGCSAGGFGGNARRAGAFCGFSECAEAAICDALSSATFWHGTRMDAWANEWTRYYTGGKGNFMVSAMEDSGTMQALTFLSQAGRMDLNRVLVLRTVSNYDREAPGTTPAASLKDMFGGKYSAYMPALEAAERVGDRVVRDIVEHWAERESTIPH
jgi:purine nucleoside permease